VLGLNALRLHDVDPVTVPCTFTREELEQVRATLPTGSAATGPRTRRDMRAFVAHERAQLGI
jgi:hypothetical protein